MVFLIQIYIIINNISNKAKFWPKFKHHLSPKQIKKTSKPKILKERERGYEKKDEKYNFSKV